MAYPLSASRLQTYHRCARQFYYQYERRLPSAAAFGSAALGTALHQTLAKVHGDWLYDQPVMPWCWVEDCWQSYTQKLTPAQTQDGLEILKEYHYRYLTEDLRKPLAVEGRIEGKIQSGNIEFTIAGRYDRIDFLDPGLHLIDYKSGKSAQPPSPEAVDVQIGLYYLALEQRYGQALTQMSLLYLRTGDMITYAATPAHKALVLEMIQDLALRLQSDQQWQPNPGKHCDRCAYRRYCSAVTPDPLPLPEGVQTCGSRPLQLVLF